MRAKKIILASMAISGSLSAIAQGAANLASELLTMPTYMGEASFEVLLPQAMDPVSYDVILESHAAADTLAPCDYLIQWSTPTTAGVNEGFSAYYSGNHYRYRNNRLQEYHAAADVTPFMPAGTGSKKRGVQYTAQFADMLPQMLGEKIMDMMADPTYTYAFHADTVVGGRRAVVIDGVKRANGYDQMEYSYVFDYTTHHPVAIEIENSPGSISEQIISIAYRPTDAEAMDISEASLIERWPEVFERYRESTFRSENLVNTSLPTFACRTLDGESERYTHHQNEPMASPTIIAVLDTGVATTSETIDAIRDAVSQAPKEIAVIWAFTSNNEADVRQAIGKLQSGETALLSAGGLVRDCGVTMFPTTILVDRTSKVQDVIAGFNNDLGLVVLQKAMIMK